MTKRAASKFKIDRRMGESIWGRPKSPVNKRSYGPGQHGQRRAKKLSDYGTQLQAKQKLKGYYGNITERQFRRYYQEASRRPGDTGENMIGLLERRLDALVYRAKFAPTPFAARQLVSHGHVKVNGKRVTIASYSLRESDLVELTAKARDMALVLEASKSPERDTPDYLEVDHGKMTAKFLRTPKLSDVPYAVQMQPHLIVEFYSR
jgi:small subunit ribosomal protein S4